MASRGWTRDAGGPRGERTNTERVRSRQGLRAVPRELLARKARRVRRSAGPRWRRRLCGGRGARRSAGRRGWDGASRRGDIAQWSRGHVRWDVGCGRDRPMAARAGRCAMIGLTGKVRVFLYAGACDMRRQISGLMTLVREELGRDPQCGDLYVFRGRRGDQIKILFYDRRGYCMLVKRLDEGTFPIAHATDGKAVEITHRDLDRLAVRRVRD